MPSSKQRKRSAQGELIAPSSVLDVIDNCLKEMCRTFPQKELAAEEIENWHRDLGVFPVEAIKWSFENWRRNGRFFPVYGDIIDQCVAWEPVKQQAECDAECKRRHWAGYGESPFKGMHDVTRLNELVRRKIQAEKRTRDQPFTDVEIDGLLDELDKMRGKAPAWR